MINTLLDTLCSVSSMTIMGTENSNDIECMLAGYYTFFFLNDIPLGEEEQIFLHFYKFIIQEYNVNQTINWGRTIRYFSKSDPESLLLFKRNLIQFKELVIIQDVDYTYYISLTKPLGKTPTTLELFNKLVKNADHFQFDSITSFHNFLEGMKLSFSYYQDLPNPFCKSFKSFVETEDIFLFYLEKKTGMSRHSNLRNNLLGYSYPAYKSLTDFLSFYEKWLIDRQIE